MESLRAIHSANEFQPNRCALHRLGWQPIPKGSPSIHKELLCVHSMASLTNQGCWFHYPSAFFLKGDSYLHTATASSNTLTGRNSSRPLHCSVQDSQTAVVFSTIFQDSHHQDVFANKH